MVAKLVRKKYGCPCKPQASTKKPVQYWPGINRNMMFEFMEKYSSIPLQFCLPKYKKESIQRRIIKAVKDLDGKSYEEASDLFIQRGGGNTQGKHNVVFQ